MEILNYIKDKISKDHKNIAATISVDHCVLFTTNVNYFKETEMHQLKSTEICHVYVDDAEISIIGPWNTYYYKLCQPNSFDMVFKKVEDIFNSQSLD